jgi:hypothetical protein
VETQDDEQPSVTSGTSVSIGAKNSRFRSSRLGENEEKEDEAETERKAQEYRE